MGYEHLKQHQFRPGQSGNPKGRPKRKTFEEHVGDILDEPQPGTDLTKRDALAHMFVDALLEGDTRLMREYLEREWPRLSRHAVEALTVEPDTVDLNAALDRFLAKCEAAGTD